MTIPPALRRSPGGHPTAALFVPGDEASAALSLCGRLGLDVVGRVFAVAGGLLVRLDGAEPGPSPGAVRLRRLADNLYLPVDATLVPSLLDDEASGLTRDRGIVFLPGGVTLGFDPGSPLAASDLLAAEPRPTGGWTPLPEPEPLADRIEFFRIARPDAPDDAPPGEAEAEEALDPGVGRNPTGGDGEGEGVGPAKGPGVGDLAKVGAGAWLVKFGSWIGSETIARAGARLIRRAIERAPRVGEAVLGRQAAALRDLLREFREGNVDRALGRALPLGEAGGDRGATPEAGDRLPPRDLAYSLKALLGEDDEGPGTVWLGGQEVLAELAKEYRRAAEKALREGDHRRAAAIYARLLRDDRAAAHALLAGGLYRDAAAVFLARLRDPAAAARAFESAGDVDRAVPLYREAGLHEQAGDLLRRVGEEAAAIVEYRAAAARLIASGKGHLAAGTLLLSRAGLADLAIEQFRLGWDLRPAGEPTSCALALADALADARPRDLLPLAGEVRDFLAPEGREAEAASAFHDLARLADRLASPADRDDLRDLARLGLAAKLRQVAPAGRADNLLSRPGAWTPAAARDVEFAARAARLRGQVAPPSAEVARVGSGSVTAVGVAIRSGTAFLGFDNGEVWRIAAGTFDARFVAEGDGPVRSIAVGEVGRSLAVLRSAEGGGGTLKTYEARPEGMYEPLLGTTLAPTDSRPWLAPVIGRPDSDRFGLCQGESTSVVRFADLAHETVADSIPADCWPAAGLLVARPKVARVIDWIGVFGDELGILDPVQGWGPLSTEGTLPGGPARPTTIAPPYASWASPEFLEIAWALEDDRFCWASLHVDDKGPELAIGETFEGGYRAVAVAGSGLIVAVTDSHVRWFQADHGGNGVEEFGSRPHRLGPVVACVPDRRSNSVLLVDSVRRLARISSPT